MNLENLTPENIMHGEIPMDNLLIDSLYYPACLTDGRPIKFCNTMWRKLGINSFVYCDYDLSEEALIRELSTQKRQVCERLIKHLEMFCTKI